MKISRTGVALGAIVAVVLAVVAPNLIWLDRSSLEVRNEGGATLTDVEVRICGSSVRIAEIPPRGLRLLFLPKCQDASLTVTVGVGAGMFEACKRSVESSMHHVEVTLTGPRAGACESGSPPFTPILLEKAIRSVL